MVSELCCVLDITELLDEKCDMTQKCDGTIVWHSTSHKTSINDDFYLCFQGTDNRTLTG
jgi:hypothetical protein